MTGKLKRLFAVAATGLSLGACATPPYRPLVPHELAEARWVSREPFGTNADYQQESGAVDLVYDNARRAAKHRMDAEKLNCRAIHQRELNKDFSAKAAVELELRACARAAEGDYMEARVRAGEERLKRHQEIDARYRRRQAGAPE